MSEMKLKPWGEIFKGLPAHTWVVLAAMLAVLISFGIVKVVKADEVDELVPTVEVIALTTEEAEPKKDNWFVTRYREAVKKWEARSVDEEVEVDNPIPAIIIEIPDLDETEVQLDFEKKSIEATGPGDSATIDGNVHQVEVVVSAPSTVGLTPAEAKTLALLTAKQEALVGKLDTLSKR